MGRRSRPTAPHGRFWGAYRVSKAYRTDVCTFRGWILCTKEKFRKQLKLGKRKKKTSEQKSKEKKVTKNKRIEKKEKGKDGSWAYQALINRKKKV